MLFDIQVHEFEDFISNPTSTQLLEWATDLFILATGITTTPTDPMDKRILQRAIYQMAWYLRSDHENREAYMTDFSSETIGNYSYNKMQQSITETGRSQIPAFDFAVDYFLDKLGKGTMSHTSEHVFSQGFNSTSPFG